MEGGAIRWRGVANEWGADELWDATRGQRGEIKGPMIAEGDR